jgi:probable F420-dependent oxidoreductase
MRIAKCEVQIETDTRMNVRIGIAIGQWPTKDLRPDAILDLVDFFEALDIDSLWMSDRIVSSALTLEPITFLSYIAGRLRKMKFGTSTLVLPTRNPVVLAKELATLDFLSHGRLFPAFGLGSDESKDLSVVGVSKKERAARADEMIALMRRLWTEENVTFEGKFYSVKDVTIMPRPWQKNGLPIWIGGRSQAAMRRTGRLGDGWLVSSVSPAEVEAGIKTIRAYAAEAGRQVPEDHYGVLIPFCFAVNGDRAFEIAERSIRPRDDLPISAFTALGSPEEVRARVQSYIRAGATKFVMRPCGPFEGWREQTEILAREVIQPLQTPIE